MIPRAKLTPVLLGGKRIFTPTDITGLRLWLKADTGIFTDDAATTPAANDGDVIAVWQDQSGNNYHVVQTTNDKRPLLKLANNGFNQHAAIRFDGSNDLLVNSTANWLSGDSSGTIVMVCQNIEFITTDCLFATADEAAVTRYVKIMPYVNPNFNLRINQRNADTDDTVRGDTTLYRYTTYVFIIRSDNSDYFLRVNGHDESLTVTSGANSGDWFDASANRDNFVLGGWKTTSETAQAAFQLSEMLVYGSNLSTDDIANIESYLINRYGVVFASKRLSYLGDSIAAQVTYGYPILTAFIYNSGSVITLNHATSTDIITGMDAQTTAAASDAADIIIIQLGTNDDNAGDMGALQAEAEENIAELKLSNASATIYWLNVLPRWTNNTTGPEVAKGNIRTAIAAACTAQSITCWDTYTDPWITQAQTSDGTHPTAAGHAAIAARINALLP